MRDNGSSAGIRQQGESRMNERVPPTPDTPDSAVVDSRLTSEAEGKGRTTNGLRVPGKKKRPSRRRIVVWVIEVTVLLACVEQFLVRPWLARRESSQPIPKVTVISGTPAPLLGEGAPNVPGISEYRAARLPALEGLADGSASARETQVMTSRQHSLPIEIENSVEMRFRLIPAGTFAMGSPESERGRWEGESQHVVPVSTPFYLGTFEVTQRQWGLVMPVNPSRYQEPDRPVEEVSWYDCQRFMLALCEREDVPAGTYRLPTEAEWEYACRGGTTTAYHFGASSKRLGAFADYAGNNDRETNVVGRRRPNAYGLFDMHGNVWEWCQDLFKAYPGGPPIDPAHKEWRMLRGGNWHQDASTCRSANRCRLPPLSKGNILGFRVFRRIDAAFSVVPGDSQPEPPAKETESKAGTDASDSGVASGENPPANKVPEQ